MFTKCLYVPGTGDISMEEGKDVSLCEACILVGEDTKPKKKKKSKYSNSIVGGDTVINE